MAWNGNTTETKTDIAKFISFCVKFFHSRFVSIFHNFFVSVNGIKIFPLTDISISVNENHTGGYPHKEWVANIIECCRAITNLQEVSHSALYQSNWQMAKQASDAHTWLMMMMMMMMTIMLMSHHTECTDDSSDQPSTHHVYSNPWLSYSQSSSPGVLLTLHFCLLTTTSVYMSTAKFQKLIISNK